MKKDRGEMCEWESRADEGKGLEFHAFAVSGSAASLLDG